ncbi:MAG TPA: DUF998 domain-containing protein [Actinomycetota bacterium]|jgi:hypothetical protein|nr:DUF998 domain-containing protein [Actinomycetota bacterium]HNE88142.1 DUF998 domain-containing protein [Actinomycetota bacterium]HNL50974.1 DUF998 domain-containing protein [Actinomycetota bacterium]HUM86237.1 DUF998 domain-containing protein [Actinomycetota bacterium]
MKTVVALFAGFWAMIFVTGLANPGYQHYRYHVSLLAADGARLIWLTTVAILLTAMAQWVAARIFWRVNRLVSLLLIVAGGALVAVALFRVPCPPRAQFCTYTVDDTPAEAVHNNAVIVYAVATMIAMIALGIVSITRGHHNLVGIPGLVAAALFALGFGGMLVWPAGLAQRTWIIVGQLWLVAAVFEAQRRRALREQAVREHVMSA